MMKLDWNDINDIAISLFEKFPDTDPQWIGFPDLHKKILELSNFEGDPNKSLSLIHISEPTRRI